MIELSSGDFRLAVAPEIGGAVVAARWRGQDILRPMSGKGGVLDTSSFPLAPYSNRIAHSRFTWRDEVIALAPNHPGDPTSPVIHGFGWLSSWEVIEKSNEELELRLAHASDDKWPWSLEMRQSFGLGPEGFEFSLSLRNEDSRDMPAGLGFHPYFPRTDGTIFHGLHRGEWQTDSDCLPMELDRKGSPIDWWDRQAVGSRCVDTVYTERQGPLTIEWPERRLGLTILPSKDLSFTTVYVPPNEGYFCVEPVSHMTNALNRRGGGTGMRSLSPSEVWEVSMTLKPYEL